MRYGENPHQQGIFYRDLDQLFNQLHGKDLSYNNLVDVDAAMQLVKEFDADNETSKGKSVFAIIKHTNVCGLANRDSIPESWKAAHAGDPDSAIGAVLICNRGVDKTPANHINEIFFDL
jgi:phosphoribosylaminoimidazolecarboxamide formyltransferase/IMP cyclohydrolase